MVLEAVVEEADAKHRLGGNEVVLEVDAEHRLGGDGVAKAVV